MSNVELLPLPEDVRAWLSSVRKVNNNGSAEHVELWFQSYARTCVTHATAAKDSEIEALRAEVERAVEVAQAGARLVEKAARQRNAAEARAERLAEALLELCNVIDGHEVPVAVEGKAAHARAALRDHDQEVGNG